MRNVQTARDKHDGFAEETVRLHGTHRCIPLHAWIFYKVQEIGITLQNHTTISPGNYPKYTLLYRLKGDPVIGDYLFAPLGQLVSIRIPGCLQLLQLLWNFSLLAIKMTTEVTFPIGLGTLQTSQ